MRSNYLLYKGISVGLIIKKDLRRMGMTQKALSSSIDMPYRKLNRLINGNGYFEDFYAEKIEKLLDYERFFIIGLQKLEKEAHSQDIQSRRMVESANIPEIRQCVFWDIDMRSLDWIKHKRFIIDRVRSYGNDREREMIEWFYAGMKQG